MVPYPNLLHKALVGGKFSCPIILDETQFTTKIGGKTSWVLVFFFCIVKKFSFRVTRLMPYYAETGRFRPPIVRRYRSFYCLLNTKIDWNEIKNVTHRPPKTFETCMPCGKITQLLTPQSLCGVVTSRGAYHTKLENKPPFDHNSSNSHNLCSLCWIEA